MLGQTITKEPAWEIAKLFPNQGDWTIDDYLNFDSKAGNHLIEYSHGIIEVLPMPSIQHQLITGYLYRLLFAFITARKLGMVLISPTKVQLWEGKIREPDVLFVSNDNVSNRTEQWFNRIDLAVEIISPDDSNLDLETKRREYAQADVAEYWIIDPRSEEVSVLTLNTAEKRYRSHGIFKIGEIATSLLLEGFEVEVKTIFDV